MAKRQDTQALKNVQIPVFRRLGFHFTIAVVATVSFTAAAFGVGASLAQRRALLEQVESTLGAVAQSRAAHISSLLDRTTDQITSLADLPEMQAIVAGRPFPGGDFFLIRQLQQPAMAVERISVYNAEGVLMMSSRPAQAGPTLLTEVNLHDVRSLTRYTPSVPPNSPPIWEVILPIWPPYDYNPIGWLRVRLYIDSLNPTLLDATGLGDSGEFYLVGSYGRHLTQVRFGGWENTYRDEWALSAARKPSWREATGLHKDYRGVSVVGTAQPVSPGVDWVLVAKMDQDEVLTPLRRLNTATLALGLLSVVLGGLAALAMSVKFTRPISALWWAADGITRGRWDLRVDSDRRDELGALSSAFNRMADTVMQALAHEQWERAKTMAILAATPNALLSFTQDLSIVLVNDGAGTVFRSSREGLVGRSMITLVPSPLVSPFVSFVREFVARDVDSEKVDLGSDLWFLPKDGMPFPGEAWLSKVKVNEQLFLTLFVADITERKRYEAQLSELADHDPLTGLSNRRHFMHALNQWMAGASGEPGSVLFIDLDHFKYVNDSLGHLAGDEVLIRTAALFRSLTTGRDVLARLGGDEFAMLLPGRDAAQAAQYGEQLLELARGQCLAVKGQVLRTAASVGIALYPEHGGTAELLLARADIALYRAKAQGRNQCCSYQPDQVAEHLMNSKLEWEHRIRSALDEHRFVLLAQPIVELDTGTVSRYELLIRMLGEDGEVIPPSAFLPVAHDFGLIGAIDRWVICRAIQMLAEQQRRGRDICLSANLSARSLSDDRILTLIKQEIEARGVRASSLILEITEADAISDLGQANVFITALKDLGCRLAIDDFGVGFSSFVYFKYLPVDYLKIDGSFIRKLPEQVSDQHLVRAMAAMARGLGIQTIAECAEDALTVTLLREYGVDYVQGYYLGRPEPLDAWLDVYAQEVRQ